MNKNFFRSLGAETKLLDSIATTKLYRNTDYLLKLSNDNLLLPFRFEAGLYSLGHKKTDFHWGWDSPLSFLRGTFTGHWLSGAAQVVAQTDHAQLRAKAEYIVSEIANCQKENGGRWAFGIPEKYLTWLRDGKRVWAPQYVCHKLMMGLFDMYKYMGNQQALDVLLGCADWFYDFTNDISRETMDDMMELEETGGIIELWADLYGVTGDEKHLTLIRRYERPRLYNLLLDGVDALTNMHANTTIPEIYGVARAYEVTGEARYRKIVEAYWKCAVDGRGTFVTGSQTGGEIWTPPFKHATRLGIKNQEFCVVYNMMRLSEYLFRWTGDSKYADYWERNFYNGILVQSYWELPLYQLMDEDNPAPKEHLAYYLPLAAGSKMMWGNETDHFWCCHCTTVQANASFHEAVFYKKEDEITVAQFLPAELNTKINGTAVKIRQEADGQAGYGLGNHTIDREITDRPNNIAMKYKINGNGQEFTLRLRKPEWLMGEMTVLVNNMEAAYAASAADASGNCDAISYRHEKTAFQVENGYAVIKKVWQDDEVTLVMPKGLRTHALPDRPNTVAFLDGPIALAGLCAEERTLYGDINNPQSFMSADDERWWNMWRPGWRTIDQPVNFAFIPMHDIGDNTYTVYFPVKPSQV